jgi:molecular chaperone DnaK (HSP70)
MGESTVPELVLAIDFGTWDTTAAMAVFGAAGPVVLEVEGSRYIPSAVGRDETSQLITGLAAAKLAGFPLSAWTGFPNGRSLLPAT